MKTRWTPTKTAIILAFCGTALAPGLAAAQAAKVAPPAEKPAAVKSPGMTVLPGEDFFA